MRPRNEQGGELIVTGTGEVQIHLLDNPHRVDVFFKKKHGPPPCDPHHHGHHHDKLGWRVTRGPHGHYQAYTLTIDWNVYEYREIFWLVYY
jgi:hypothetical protein